MGRTIKFRGLRTDVEGWVYGYLIIEPDGTNWIDHYPDGLRRTTKVIPETVGQFIGLHDKNGVEIYDGDVSLDEYGNLITITWIKGWGIFACLINEEYDNYIKNGVEYLDETMFWSFPISYPNRITITGNIHEKTSKE